MLSIIRERRTLISFGLKSILLTGAFKSYSVSPDSTVCTNLSFLSGDWEYLGLGSYANDASFSSGASSVYEGGLPDNIEFLLSPRLYKRFRIEVP